jgi:hypothetical protein
MKRAAHVLFGVGLLVLANGAGSFFLRYNFITRRRYGPSLEPVYIIAAGIGILVVGMVIKTIADSLSDRKPDSDASHSTE